MISSYKIILTILSCFILAGCSGPQEKAPTPFLHLTTNNVNGKIIQAVEKNDVSELKYNGRGMQLKVHLFGDVPLNSEAVDSASKGKHIDLIELDATFDLTHDQWKPVFEAWFHHAAAIPLKQALHPTSVSVDKRALWQYTSAVAASGKNSRYIRAYLIPQGKHAIVIQSRGWIADDASSYDSYLDDLAASVDSGETPK